MTKNKICTQNKLVKQNAPTANQTESTTELKKKLVTESSATIFHKLAVENLSIPVYIVRVYLAGRLIGSGSYIN